MFIIITKITFFKILQPNQFICQISFLEGVNYYYITKYQKFKSYIHLLPSKLSKILKNVLRNQIVIWFEIMNSVQYINKKTIESHKLYMIFFFNVNIKSNKSIFWMQYKK